VRSGNERSPALPPFLDTAAFGGLLGNRRQKEERSGFIMYASELLNKSLYDFDYNDKMYSKMSTIFA